MKNTLSRTPGRATVWAAAVLVGLLLWCPVKAGEPGPDAETRRDFVDTAFAAFLKRVFQEDKLEVLTFEEPCGTSLCMGYGLSRVSRDKLVKFLPQASGGFGYGADVARLTLRGHTDVLSAADVEVVVSPSVRLKPDELTRRASMVLDFFHYVSGLSEQQKGQFSPRLTAEDARVYFLLELTCEFGRQECTAYLLAPPRAAAPGGGLPGDGCVEVRVEPGGCAYSTGLFAGWKRFVVTRKHVCKDPDKPIQ